jgi:membrane-associated phospholipid phosphatase
VRSFFVICFLLFSRFAFASGGDSTRVDSIAKPAIAPISPTGGIDRTADPHLFDIVTNLPADWRDYAVQNVRPKFWPQMAAITISTAALIVYDSQLWTPIYKQYKRGGAFGSFADVFSYMGDGKSQFGLAAAIAGYGIIAGDKRAIRTSAQVCEAILACGAVVQLLKHTTGRESPFVSTTKTGRWDFFPNQIDYAYHVPHYDAFPSGHLATALTTVTVIANNYSEITWLKPAGYALCAAISTGLVAQGIHWWSDFPLSIALGIGFGNLISPSPDRDKAAKEPNEKKDIGLLDKITLFPVYENGAPALAMSVRF